MAKSNSGSNDLIMRLVLENKQLTENLNKTQNQFTNFKSKVEKQSEGVSTALTGIAKKAGAIGIAFVGLSSAQSAFDGIINSSQTLADKWNNNTKAMEESTKDFFYAIGNGDFTAFSNGLTEIFNKAKSVQEALDQLGNAQMSYNYRASDLSQQMAVQREIITDPDKSKQEKELALKEIDNILAQKAAYIENLGADRLKAIKTQIAKGTALKEEMVDLNHLDAILEMDITNSVQRDAIKSEMSALYEEYKAKMAAENKRYKSTNRNGYTQSQLEYSYKSHQDKLSEITSEYSKAVMFNQLLNKFSDEELQGTINLLTEQRALNIELSNEERTRNRLAKQVLKGDEPKTPKTPTPTLSRDDQWRKLGYEVQEYTYGDELADSILNKFVRKISTMQMPPVEIPVKIEEEEQLTENESPVWVDPTIKLESNLNILQSATASINSMLSDTAGLLAQSGSEWGAWGIQAAGTIASVIGQYASLIAMQMTSSVAQQGKLPFPYNLAAMAATASGMIAIIASLPKFATGGIVEGSSKYGDRVMAMVNAGEMVLNNSQQSRLFNILDGKTNSNSISGNNVTFRISGADLVGAISNHNKRITKVL